MKLFACILCFAALFTLSTQARADSVVFHQAPSDPSNYYLSSHPPYAFEQSIMVDQFTLANNTQVNEITWQGVHLEDDAVGQISGFDINFYANDAGGNPFDSTLLYDLHFDGLSNEAISGFFVEHPGGGTRVYDIASYSAPLSYYFQAGVPYWVSIVADTNGYRAWGWDASDQGSGLGYSFNPPFIGSSGNAAFSLSGVEYIPSTTPPAATPEPSSIALLGTGMLGIAGAVRRKFSRV